MMIHRRSAGAARTPRTLLMVLVSAALAGLPIPSHAGDGRPAVVDARAFDDPSGLLPKVVLTEPGALFETIDGAPVPVDAFAIYFWLKQDGRAITAVKGEEWIRVGDAPGHPVGWLKNRGLVVWRTRALLYPLPPKNGADKRFTVTMRDGSVATFNGGGPDRLELALVLAPPKDFLDPLYEVAVFNADVGKATGKVNQPAPKGGDDSVNTENLKLEIVFVIDTTASMTPLIEGTKGVIRSVVDYLDKNPNLKGVARFGLVEYQDSSPGLVPSRVVSPLTDDAGAFLAKLEPLRAATTTSEETAEDVLAGLLKAIDQPSGSGASKEIGWLETSSKHIILLGDASAHQSGPKNTTGLTYAQINALARPDSGTDVNRLLRSITFHAVRAVNTNDPDDSARCAAEFLELAKNKGTIAGFYADVEPGDPASVRKVMNDLLDLILKGIAHTKTLKQKGSQASVQKAGQLTNPIAQSLYKIVADNGNQMDLPIGTVITGTAKTHDQGRQVAIEKILVTKGEIKKLKITLDFLYSQFEDLVEPEKRKDVSSLLDVLQETTLSILAGQRVRITEGARPDQLLAVLPFHNDALKLHAADIALMTPDAYRQWLQKLDAARRISADILEKGEWVMLGAGTSKSPELFGFIRLEDLP